MGAFKDLQSTARGFTSNYLRKGRYVARIDACDSFEPEGKGLMWKNTLTILAVKEGDHKVGEEVHIFFHKGKYPKMFLQKIKGFIAGVMGAEDADVGEAEAEDVLSEDNPMAGMVTVVTAVDQASTKSRNDDGSPKIFTNYSFSEQLTSEEIEEAIGADAVSEYFPNGLS